MKGIVCECHRKNIHSEHYEHKIVYLKEFFVKEKYFCFRDMIEKFKKFIDYFSKKVDESRQLFEFMQDCEELLLYNLSEMENKFLKSGIVELEGKIMNFQDEFKKKKTSMTLEKIF